MHLYTKSSPFATDTDTLAWQLGMTKEDLKDATREADYYRAMGWFNRAVRLYTEVIPRCPPRSVILAEILAKRSAAYDGLLDYESALEDANASIAAHGRSHHGHLAAGNALCGLQFYDKATRHFKQGLHRCPGHRELLDKYEFYKCSARSKVYGVSNGVLT